MTNRVSINVVVLYMGLVYVVGIRSSVEGLPTTGGVGETPDRDFMEDKVEIFKQDILNRLGYNKKPDVSNITQNIEEKRKMIQKYRKYIEEREIASHQEDKDNEENNVKSRTFYSLQYEGMYCMHSSIVLLLIKR